MCLARIRTPRCAIGCGHARARRGRNSSEGIKRGAVSQFHLPAPWSAPEDERVCPQCGRVTLHYARRVTTANDPESDRSSGELIWFCNECGHRPPSEGAVKTDAPADHDDLTELFDRH
jgi:hypothetical protein